MGISRVAENPGAQHQGTVLVCLPVAVLVEAVADIGFLFDYSTHTRPLCTDVSTGAGVPVIASIGVGGAL